ncbi:alpha/beta hydrolase family protein [Psychroserpens sp.]|uniref:alpha/beta hydrolase family protein n=1 Tax=Psychroserpens sp. TaxID=2020870 RepID=UPI0038594099
MKTRFFKLITTILVLLLGIALAIFIAKNQKSWSLFKIQDSNSQWSKEFEIAEIKSSKDNSIQKSYVYKSNSIERKPLVVSLHTWSGDYKQKDDLAELCKLKDLNYIHPNFRGANNTVNACSSELALTDIDDAITYAINNFNVDTNNIYVIGKSGGGYATLSAFMKSKHNIKKYSAWASMTDLIAWYEENKLKDNKYAKNILDCLGSETTLDIEKAKLKSPLYWHTPIEKLEHSKLTIYAGVYDGIQGSVPITHSINFYNKLLRDMSLTDSLKYVSNSEKSKLLEKREPLGEYGNIAGRKIYLKKQFRNLSLIIFEGNHEMLTEFALDKLLEE